MISDTREKLNLIGNRLEHFFSFGAEPRQVTCQKCGAAYYRKGEKLHRDHREISEEEEAVKFLIERDLVILECRKCKNHDIDVSVKSDGE